MADGGSPGHAIARIAAIVGGLVLLVASGFALEQSQPYALLLAALGGLLLVLGLFRPGMKSAKLGSAEIQFQDEERDAAAEVAALEPPAAVEAAKRIDSDDETPPTPSDEDAEVIGILNFTAGNMALQAIFDWTTAEGQPLQGCSMRLYLLDEEASLLKAVLAPDEVENATAWEIGHGATGAAYESGDYVLATGDAVWDTTYKVSTAQAARFRRTLAAVAAAPVFNATGTKIGVVTVSTPSLDHSLDTDEARRDHTLAALLVSRVLVELLQWFDDD